MENIAHASNPKQMDRSVFPQLLGCQGHNLVHLRLVLPEAPSNGSAEEGVVVDKGGGDGPQVWVDPALDDAVQGLGVRWN